MNPQMSTTLLFSRAMSIVVGSVARLKRAWLGTAPHAFRDFSIV